MEKTIRKWFIDYEKEEAWINQKCENGLALVSYSWGKYIFEKCNPSEYVYRIEFFSNLPKSSKSADYMELLKESNIEVISIYGSWVYLRKKASDGVFDIFSDNHSKINHIRKVATLYYIVALLQLLVGSNLIIQGIVRSENMGVLNIVLICLSVFFFIFGITLLSYGRKLQNRIKKLEKESSIYE